MTVNSRFFGVRVKQSNSDEDHDNTFRPISPDLVDPTIAARQRAAEMEELKKQSLAFTANMAKKTPINEPTQPIQKAPIMKRPERKKKYESDSGA